jgi:hypothetical protein
MTPRRKCALTHRSLRYDPLGLVAYQVWLLPLPNGLATGAALSTRVGVRVCYNHLLNWAVWKHLNPILLCLLCILAFFQVPILKVRCSLFVRKLGIQTLTFHSSLIAHSPPLSYPNRARCRDPFPLRVAWILSFAVNGGLGIIKRLALAVVILWSNGCTSLLCPSLAL